jgi:hypothetical protein
VSHFRASGARCSFGRDELDKSTLAWCNLSISGSSSII